MLKGLITALISPMKENFALDFDMLKNLISTQIESGVDGILVLGSTGEGHSLTEKEKVEVIKTTVLEAKGIVPILAGIGSSATSHALEEASLYSDLGVDYLLISAPSYNRPMARGLYAHFKSIHDCCKTPIIIYNHPGRTGVAIPPDLIASLASLPRIVGVKQASGCIQDIDDTIQLTPSSFSVYAGDDLLAYPAISLGASGLISVLSNLIPKIMSELVHTALNGKHSHSLKIHREIHSLCKASGWESNPIPIKYAMQRAKLPSGPCRLPLTPLSEEFHSKFNKIIDQHIIWKK